MIKYLSILFCFVSLYNSLIHLFMYLFIYSFFFFLLSYHPLVFFLQKNKQEGRFDDDLLGRTNFIFIFILSTKEPQIYNDIVLCINNKSKPDEWEFVFFPAAFHFVFKNIKKRPTTIDVRTCERSFFFPVRSLPKINTQLISFLL